MPDAVADSPPSVNVTENAVPAAMFVVVITHVFAFTAGVHVIFSVGGGGGGGGGGGAVFTTVILSLPIQPMQPGIAAEQVSNCTCTQCGTPNGAYPNGEMASTVPSAPAGSVPYSAGSAVADVGAWRMFAVAVTLMRQPTAMAVHVAGGGGGGGGGVGFALRGAGVAGRSKSVTYRCGGRR